MSHYNSSRGLAITAGIAATGGATALLLAEPLTTGHWTMDHGLVPLVVGLTVASGHLAASAARSLKPLATIGFSVAFAIGTGTTMLNGIGRQAEGADTKLAEATKVNDAIGAKQSELSKARIRLDQANTMAEKEMTGQKCGVRCNDWKTRAGEVSSHIRTLEAELTKLGITKPVNAKAAKVAELASVLGFDADKAKVAITLVEPMLVPTLLELMAIVALGYGFAHENGRRNVATLHPSSATIAATVANDDEPGPTGGNRRPVKRTVATRAAAEADVIRLIARGERLPPQGILAARWGIHAGTASKWCADFERRGIIARHVEGRCKRLVAA